MASRQVMAMAAELLERCTSHDAEGQDQSWGAGTLNEEVNGLLSSQPVLRPSGACHGHREEDDHSREGPLHAERPQGSSASGAKASRKEPAVAQAFASGGSSSDALSELSGPSQQPLRPISPEVKEGDGAASGRHSPSCDYLRPRGAAAGIAAPRMTSTVAILRHSAAVCSALGRAAASITAQASTEGASLNADDLLEVLEHSLGEEQSADPVLNSLLAAPMLSAFIHAFRSEASSGVAWSVRGGASQRAAAALDTREKQSGHAARAETNSSQRAGLPGDSPESAKQRPNGQPKAASHVNSGAAPSGAGAGAGAGSGMYGTGAESEATSAEPEKAHRRQWRIQQHTGQGPKARQKASTPYRDEKSAPREDTSGDGTLGAPEEDPREAQSFGSGRGGRAASGPSAGGRQGDVKQGAERSERDAGFASEAHAQEVSAGYGGVLSELQQVLLATNPVAAIALGPALRAPPESHLSALRAPPENLTTEPRRAARGIGHEARPGAVPVEDSGEQASCCDETGTYGEGWVRATTAQGRLPGKGDVSCRGRSPDGSSDGEAEWGKGRNGGGRREQQSSKGAGVGGRGVGEESREEEEEEGGEEGVVHIRRLAMRGRGRRYVDPENDLSQMPEVRALGLSEYRQGAGDIGALVHSSLLGPGASHSALGPHSGAGGGASAALMLAARAVAAMEQHNRLTAASLAQGHAAAQLQAQQLQVSLESTNLMKTEVELAKEKQVSRIARDKEARAEKELERFLRQLADELLFGLLIMLLGLLYAGWNTAGGRLQAEAMACLRLQEDTYEVTWFSAYRVDRAVMKALRFVGCKLSVGLQLFMACGIVGSICYFLIVTNVLGSQASRPASVILFTLAGVCGYCGFQAVQFAGGSALLWLLLWELLCALHTACCFYAPSVFLLLHGRRPGGAPPVAPLKPDPSAPAGTPQGGGGKRSSSSSSHGDCGSDTDSESELHSDFDSDSVAARGMRGARRVLRRWVREGLREIQAQASRVPPWFRATAFHLSISLVLPLCTALLPFLRLPTTMGPAGRYWG